MSIAPRESFVLERELELLAPEQREPARAFLEINPDGLGAPPAIANAIVDALWHLGVRHIDIPITPQKVWRLLRKHGVTE